MVEQTNRPDISVVMPVYNEEENISELYTRLTNVLAATISYELLFVENGSWDNSARLLSDLRQTDKRVKILSLSRNFGHQQLRCPYGQLQTILRKICFGRI